ncbi:MAG: OmpH family outer membrane protein [Candidatus Sumerlaeota bacterium]|nr:OmpH family outer membrane protein [Candidatus Sumerlaeota bacterium]
MKRIPAILAVIILAPFILCGAGETRIGYVDVDRVTSKAKPVNNLMGSAAEQIKKLQGDIETKTRQITGMEADIKRTDGILAKEESDKKRKEVLRLRNEADDLMTKARQKSREVESTVYEPLLKKIGAAIQDVAKERNIEIVLPGAAVLYGSPAADLTDDVIRKLNEDAGDATRDTRASSKEDSKTPADAEKIRTAETGTAKPAEDPAPETKTAAPAATAATPIADAGATTQEPQTPPQQTQAAPAPTPASAEPAAKTAGTNPPTPAEPTATPAKERAPKTDATPKTAKKSAAAAKPSPTRGAGTRPVDRQPE